MGQHPENTTNKVAAAPIRISEELLRALRSTQRAIANAKPDEKPPSFAEILDGWVNVPGVLKQLPEAPSTKQPLSVDILAELNSLREIAWELADRLDSVGVSGGLEISTGAIAQIRAKYRASGARARKRKSDPKGPKGATGT